MRAAAAPKVKVPTEDDVHKSILRWIKMCAPECMVWHTPNGGSRHLFEAFNLKKLGVRSGVPDLTILPKISAAGPGVAHFLEIKRTKGSKTSFEQIVFMREAEERGARGRVVKSIEEARAAFAEWGIPTREARS